MIEELLGFRELHCLQRLKVYLAEEVGIKLEQVFVCLLLGKRGLVVVSDGCYQVVSL